jgi:hypothetical protein
VKGFDLLRDVMQLAWGGMDWGPTAEADDELRARIDAAERRRMTAAEL